MKAFGKLPRSTKNHILSLNSNPLGLCWPSLSGPYWTYWPCQTNLINRLRNILMFWRCALRSWYHEISIHSRAVSPQLEDNIALKCTSDSFPRTQYMSQCVEKCPNYIAMYRCSPIAGIRSWKVGEKNYGTNLCPSFLSFWTFSPQLENKGTSKCSSDSFPCMVTNMLCVENCRKFILMHHFPLIAGRLSQKV